MVDVDQKMRKRAIGGKIKWDKNVDRRSAVRLKKIIKKYGWPTKSSVGKKASHGAWLLAQHADHDLKFQKKVLKLMSSISVKNINEVSLANIAYLTDRILVHENKPQFFGTQFKKNKKGVFEPFKVRNGKNVDKRRKKYGLPTLKENKSRINKEWNKLTRE